MIKQFIFAVVLLSAAFMIQAAEPIDINTADVITLEQKLMGIGAQKARAIVKYREEHGPFKSIEDLALVSGVGEKILAKNRGKISVSNTK